MATSTESGEPWYLRSGVPVLTPVHDGLDLSMSQPAFDSLVRDIVRSRDATQQDDTREARDLESEEDDSLTLVSAATTTTHEIRSTLVKLKLVTTDETRTEESLAVDLDKLDEPDKSESHQPSVQGLPSHDGQGSLPEVDMENKMLTENAGVAYRSTKSPILDLFTELEEVVSGPRLLELLGAAWAEDSLATLKIIFNARSIHLGKASRATFYRCAGWLAQYHPLTLIVNLRWLSRPIIQKKAEEKLSDVDADMVIVDMKPEEDVDDESRFDVKHGVSHGYWKDLLNILVLSVDSQLNALAKHATILNVEKQGKLVHNGPNQEEAKALRRNTRKERHDRATRAFDSDPVYRGIYLTVARLFAEQLKKDLDLLHSDDPKAAQRISLCAKWAPSHDKFHDRHTFIVSSIAEMLHPTAGGADCTDRELYLRHAREAYRRDVSALRAHLDIVERKLSFKTYDKIRYERLPSLAMNKYTKIFAEKDTERFDKYLTDVARGKMSISGATLLPSTLIKPFRELFHGVPASRGTTLRDPKSSPKVAIAAKMQELAAKVASGQWGTLVQRIKDSGHLASSIAVCDVSGSMNSPVFADGTCPLDSAIGLSLLLAEVTAPPFGGHFITFSRNPELCSIDPSWPLGDKFSRLVSSDWGMNTDFAAVFTRLLLPVALRNKVPQANMVKRVFVFSDMQFDEADSGDALSGRFGTSFEHIKRRYAEAGYEMPELVFWNLAGGRAGYGPGSDGGDPTAPKPVTSGEPGTAIVSGYSQSMLKVFLDGGSFDEPEDDDGDGEGEDVKMADDGDDDDTVVVESGRKMKKRKMDPMSIVRRAISHKGYDPLVVVD